MAFGVNRAKEILGDQMDREPMSPDTDLYHPQRKLISTLIVDQSHRLRKSTTTLHAAVSSLRYKTVFLVTGTPQYEGWDDYAGQLMLLPGGGPFVNADHYRRVFPGSNGVVPYEEHREMRTKLLAGFKVKSITPFEGLWW